MAGRAGVFISVVGTVDARALQQAQQELAKIGEEADRAGSTLSGRFRDVGRSIATAGDSIADVGQKVTTRVTLPILAAGTAAVAAFNQVDEGLDTIAATTGATGEQLAGLQTVFENVAQNATQDLQTVGSTIGQLHQRLGITGPALEDLSTRMLDLARITGGDATTSVREITRAMTDWSVPAEQAPRFLDELLRVSQLTGATVDDLAAKMVQFGSPLRQVGFSAGETAALLGSFEQAGVNTELVMGSLRIALGKLAKAGEQDLPAALRESIQAIADAKTGGEAAALAIETFGARAGPDMAAAIREGRFAVGDLIEALETSRGTLDRTAQSTDGLEETLSRVKNQVLLAGASLGQTLAPYLEQAAQLVARAAEAFANLDPGMQRIIIVAGGIAAAIGPIITIVGRLTQGFGLLVQGIGFLIPAHAAQATAAASAATAETALAGATAAVAAPIALAVAAIGALVGGFMLAYEHSEAFRNIIHAVVNWLSTTFVPIIEEVGAFVAAVWEDIAAWTRQVWPMIQQVISTVLDVIREVVEAFTRVVMAAWRLFGDNILTAVRTVWNLIKTVIQTAIDIVQGIITTVLALITGKWRQAWDGIKEILSGIWNLIKGIVRAAIDAVRNTIDAVLDAIRAIWTGAWNGIKAVAEGIWDGIKSVVRGAINGVKNVIDNVLDSIRAVWRGAWNAMKDVATGIWDGIVAAVKTGVNAIIRILNAAIMGINALIRGYNAIPFAPDIPTIPHIPELARGGTISEGGMAIVGERGAELLELPRGAQVTPLTGSQANAALARMGNSPVVINVTFQGPVGDNAARDVQRVLAEFAQDVTRRLRSA